MNRKGLQENKGDIMMSALRASGGISKRHRVSSVVCPLPVTWALDYLSGGYDSCFRRCEISILFKLHRHILCRLCLHYFLCQSWNRLEQIRNQTRIGHLEDWRVRIFVDSHNHLALLHPRQMLDCAGDPHGQV